MHASKRSLQSLLGEQPAQNLRSWFRAHLDVSIELLDSARVNASSRVIDIGGGVSTLVDDLLDRGVCSAAVLDISAFAGGGITDARERTARDPPPRARYRR